MVFGSVRVAILLGVSFKDFTYSGKTLHIVTISEAAVSIMVASSPLLRPIFDQVWRGSIISSSRNSKDRKKCKSGHSSQSASLSISPQSMKNKSQGFEVMDDGIKLTPVHVNQHVTRIDAESIPSILINGRKEG